MAGANEFRAACDWLGAWADMLAKAVEPAAGESAAGGREAQRGTELSAVFIQSGLIGATSALRYWQALTEIYVQHQRALMQTAGDRATMTDPAARRRLADSWRAYLREIGDAASQEARRLQSELNQLGEWIAQIVARDDPSPVPVRQHRVKE